jgi:hypothetical protein
MRALGLALGLILAVGCAAAPAGTLVGCPMALIEGTLVGQPPNYLSLVLDDGEAVDVDWSERFAINSGDPITLVDPNGLVVARAGDRVTITGGALRGPGTWTECGSVKLTPAAT